MNRFMTSLLISSVVIAMPFSVLGSHWYTYTIACILAPIAFWGAYAGYPNKNKIK